MVGSGASLVHSSVISSVTLVLAQLPREESYNSDRICTDTHCWVVVASEISVRYQFIIWDAVMKPVGVISSTEISSNLLSAIV